jgi:hypothetical protein
MALNLYRRHRQECEAGHPEETRSGEFEERNKGWKPCACLIFASGTLAGTFNRITTGTRDWDEAKVVIRTWQDANSWNGKSDPPPIKVERPVPGRVAIADAVKVFLTNREAAKIAPATLRKYKTFTKQLTTFTASRGYIRRKYESRHSRLWYRGADIGHWLPEARA